ncbi:hypothetical protein AAC387_Pa02g1386 [Persea americana]
MRWEKVQLSGRPRETAEGKKSPGRIGGILGPGKRWGHTCNAIKGGRLLYVFGGYGKDNCQTNDVHVFDTFKQTWSKIMVKGNPPSPRDSHSCTTVGNNLYVFGGTDGKSPLKDLHILDTSSNTWIVPSISGEGPEAREGHSAILVDKRLFIFGGCGKSYDEPEEVYFNDLYILDTERFIWNRAITSGTPPSARDSHTCSSWRNKIIVIGGEDASDYYLSDVHILDVDTLVWRELNTSGQLLTPRAGHSTVALGKHLFVFGGFTDDRNLYDDLHVLNVDAGIWSKVTCAGPGPSARFSVAGDCLDLQKGILVFIGGCNESLEALDDMYYLYTDMSTENGQDEQKQEKFSLRKELKRKCQEQYLLPPSRSEKDISKVGMVPDSCQSLPLPRYGQAGNQKTLPYEFKPQGSKTFEAKVTNTFHYGYTIETNIDGKPLRGILFSYKTTLSHGAHSYFTGRAEVDGEQLKDRCGTESKITGDTNQEMRSNYRQADDVHVKESTSQESPMETVGSDSNNSIPVDVSHLQVSHKMVPHPDSQDGVPNELHKPGGEDSDPNDFHTPMEEDPCVIRSIPTVEMDSSPATQQDVLVSDAAENQSSMKPKPA